MSVRGDDTSRARFLSAKERETRDALELGAAANSERGFVPPPSSRRFYPTAAASSVVERKITGAKHLRTNIFARFQRYHSIFRRS